MIPKSIINLYNIPELDSNYENTYDFYNISSQSNYFNARIERSLYDAETLSAGFTNYSYIRNNTIRVDAHVDSLLNYNYLSFNNGYKTYYAFITDKQYLSDNATNITYEIDVMQSYMFDYQIMDSYVDRCHVNRWNGNTPTKEIIAEDIPLGDMKEIGRETVYKYDDQFIITSTAPMGMLSGVGIKPPPSGGGDNSAGDAPASSTRPSDNIVYYMKEKEGFSPIKYYCPSGVLTQGYGFTGGYILNKDPITEDEATQQLLKVMKNFYEYLFMGLTVAGKNRLTQSRADAICCLMYNIGKSAWAGSTIREMINSKNGLDLEELKKEWLSWNKGKVNGVLQVLPGLTKRRQEEFNIFVNGDLSDIGGYGRTPYIAHKTNDSGRVSEEGGWGAKPKAPFSLERTNNISVFNETNTLSNEGVNDNMDAMMNGIPYGMYFYFMNKNSYKTNLTINGVLTETINTKALSCPTIQSITYAPYLSELDLSVYPVLYDSKRFGDVDPTLPQLPENNAILFRINGFNNNSVRQVKTLGAHTKYYDINRNTPYRNWRHESKLYQYPYSYSMVTDYLSAPILIAPHLVEKDLISIKVATSISDKCTYSLFIDGYKGDRIGNMEGAIMNSSLDMPVASSAYAQFMATSKAQYMATNASAMGNLVKGALQCNIKGLASTVISSQNQVMMNKAGALDTIDTPKSVLTMGGDVPFSRCNSENKVEIIRYRLDEEYLEMIGDYFAMYGYKQDKIIRPNLRSRWFYNYIKCYKANIKSGKISKEELSKIKNIYENGITIWHVDRDPSIDPVIPLDYSKDNIEA